jgi:hypothetical protein
MGCPRDSMRDWAGRRLRRPAFFSAAGNPTIISRSGANGALRQNRTFQYVLPGRAAVMLSEKKVAGANRNPSSGMRFGAAAGDPAVAASFVSHEELATIARAIVEHIELGGSEVRRKPAVRHHSAPSGSGRDSP